jgi:hypothetical protein
MEPGEEEAGGAGASPRLCDESNYSSLSNLIFRKDALPQLAAQCTPVCTCGGGTGGQKAVSDKTV